MLQLGGAGDRPAGGHNGADDVDPLLRARQDEQQALAVLAEATAHLRGEPTGRARVDALAAQAVALHQLGRIEDATRVARTLAALCRDLGLPATGLLARALLADLLRRQGAAGPALEELALAVVAESGLRDGTDPRVQAALTFLVDALRGAGAEREARRVVARLEELRERLDPGQQVRLARGEAFAQAWAALAAARRPPYRPDVAALHDAVALLRGAERLAGDAAFPAVAAEADVLTALLAAISGRPDEALALIDEEGAVRGRGSQAPAARMLSACARVHALVRLGRAREATDEGHRLLAELDDGPADTVPPGDRSALAFEVLRAEEALLGREAVGARAFVALAERRHEQDGERLEALFRTRVAAARGAAERRSLARAARLDSLTGLVNRRGAAVAVAAAAGRPDGGDLALLLIDLDRFGRVNDGCGHLAGDVVLQRVASVLRAHVRPEDLVARWGADEFLVLVTAGVEAAARLADRLREAIRDGGDPAVGDAVTASVGVAVRGGPISSEEWLRRAELARFTAWRGGGDTTALA